MTDVETPEPEGPNPIFEDDPDQEAPQAPQEAPQAPPGPAPVREDPENPRGEDVDIPAEEGDDGDHADP